MNKQIQRDLSAKLQQGLGAVLQRDIEIAGVVLDSAARTQLMLEAAVMMMRTVAASCAASIEDPAKVEQVFDMTLDAIITMARDSRSASLQRIHAVRQGAA